MLHVTNSYFVLFVVVILPFSYNYAECLFLMFSLNCCPNLQWIDIKTPLILKLRFGWVYSAIILGATSLTNRYSTLSHHDIIIKKVKTKYEKVLELASNSRGRRKRRKRRTKRAAAAQTCKKFMDLMDECKLFFSYTDHHPLSVSKAYKGSKKILKRLYKCIKKPYM